MKAVVFDIGGVLVDWKPHLAWVEALGSEDAAHAFIERTDFLARNARGDNGELFADLAQELDDPQDQRLFAAYVGLYTRTVENAIHGTWDVLDRLRAQGTPVHAITNWSAETWPIAAANETESARFRFIFQLPAIRGRRITGTGFRRTDGNRTGYQMTPNFITPD